MAKKKNIIGQLTLDLFPQNETGGITNQKEKGNSEIKKTLSNNRQRNSVVEFLDEKGKLDIIGFIEEGRASELAQAFAEDIEKQKNRKSDYIYQRELEDFLGKIGYDNNKIRFEGSINGLKKLFQFIHDNKPTTHVLDEKKTRGFLLNKLKYNTYLNILFKKLNIYPGSGKLYNRFYGSIIELLKNPKIIQQQVPEITQEKIAEKINEFFTKQDVKITASEIRNLSIMIHSLDIFKEEITSIDYNSLSMGLQAYIKDDKNKRKELNILHLTPARFSRYLTSLFISYNRTQEQKDQPGRKIQALNKTFEIQFLKTYKDKNKKKDSGVIYAKDINTDDELPQKEILEEKRNFTAEEITKISSDLKKIGNSTFYRLVEVREKISAKEMINLIYNIAQKAPETKEEAVQEFIQKFHNNEKEEDKKILEDFIRKAVKYFQKK